MCGKNYLSMFEAQFLNLVSASGERRGSQPTSQSSERRGSAAERRGSAADRRGSAAERRGSAAHATENGTGTRGRQGQAQPQRTAEGRPPIAPAQPQQGGLSGRKNSRHKKQQQVPTFDDAPKVSFLSEFAFFAFFSEDLFGK